MDFIDQLKQFSSRIETLKDNIHTEEATKTSLVMPFFSMLGYDVFNPAEFILEYTADVGIKKGEKVDYAIMFDNEPMILIEAKSITEKLDKHASQLFRYFGTSKAKFAILTNGIIYQFFTDLEEANKMDEKPFLEIDMLDIKEYQVAEIKKYTKATFDVEEIFSVASDLKYSNKFKTTLAEELHAPSDEFVKFFLSKCYDGRQTQPIIDKFKSVLKKSLNSYVTELMSDKIKTALGAQDSFENITVNVTADDLIPAADTNKIVTTEEELEAYFLVKTILSDKVAMTDITYKDTERYMSILYKNKVTNWICRLHFNSANKYITIPDSSKKPVRIDIADIYDIKKNSKELMTILENYL